MPIVLVCVFLAVAGRWIWWVEPANPERRAEESLLALLAGFAFSSVGLFLLAHVGRLSAPAIAVVAAAGVAGGLARRWRRGVVASAATAPPRDLALGATLAAIVTLSGIVLPPIDATLAGSDSSVYLATARHLAATGTIVHHDPLVTRMSAGERDVLLRNRFANDNTGRHARFPGGVLLLSPSTDVVSFYFYHLFPVWLAAGLATVGESYLGLLAMFGAIGGFSLFFIGRRLGGVTLGLSLCLVHACFQPQTFYTRLPSSEILAQALFLSALFVYLRALDADEEARQPYLHLAGLLWGALFLCRVDAIPFVWLGLTSVSLLPRRLRIGPNDWAIPMLWTALFAGLAVYHQLANGIDYVGAFRSGPLGARVGLFLVAHRWTEVGLAALVCAGSLLIARALRTIVWRWRVILLVRAFGVIVSAATVVRFLAAFEVEGIATHLRWFEMYMTTPGLWMLTFGACLAVALALRSGGSRAEAVVAALFLGPACCYLIDPMTIGYQPWAIRRYVPIVFPLLFILALCGWHSTLRRLFAGRPALSRAAFGTVVVSIATCLGAAPAGLLSWPATTRTASQVRALSAALPSDALVLVPDEQAGVHLQLGLQYTGQRDVLLFPLNGSSADPSATVLAGFLDRELAGGRRVFVVLAGRPDAATSLARRFQLDPRFERLVTYEAVPFAPTDALPGRPERAALRRQVLELRPRTAPGSAD